MTITLRQEKPTDYESVFRVVRDAFELQEHSDHNEHFLINRLRASSSFIPELSIVAINQRIIVGHILLSEIKIENKKEEFTSLALAPVSVLPRYQKSGIGGMLIHHAHEEAKLLGYKSVIVLGHATYYPKFGYVPAHHYGINLPFEVPKENCLAKELITDGLMGVSGTVIYPKEFSE